MQIIAKITNAKIKIGELFGPVETSGENCICIGP